MQNPFLEFSWISAIIYPILNFSVYYLLVPIAFLVIIGSSTGASSGDLIDLESNVILIHEFLSSSYLWIETIYPSLFEATKLAYKFFVVGLLGFGKSPNPSNCSYTVTQHVDTIEKSVVQPYKVNSFHLVTHSMGFIISLELAAKHQNMLRMITLLSLVSTLNSSTRFLYITKLTLYKEDSTMVNFVHRCFKP